MAAIWPIAPPGGGRGLGPVPSVHVNIISWEGMQDAARAIAGALAPHADRLSVIYSNRAGTPEDGPGEWRAVPQSWFFGRKFAFSLTQHGEADILLQIQADTRHPDWPEVLRRCRAAFAAVPDLGIWAPRRDRTPYVNMVTGRHAGSGLDEVLQTDGVVWALSPAVVGWLRGLDYGHNNLGWGIDWAALAHARAAGLSVLTDPALMIEHLPGRGYADAQARRQMLRFLEQLPEREARCHADLAALVGQRQRAAAAALPAGFPDPPSGSTPEADAPGPIGAVLSCGRLLARLPLEAGTALAQARLWLGATEVALSPVRPAQILPRFLNIPDHEDDTVSIGQHLTPPWHFPGQIVHRIRIRRPAEALDLPLSTEIEIPAGSGDQTLRLWIAAHRTIADLRLEVQSPGQTPPDRIFTRFDKGFNAMGAAGFQPVSLTIAGADVPRRLRLHLNHWWHDTPPGGAPPVLFVTSPVLTGAALAPGMIRPVVASHPCDGPTGWFEAHLPDQPETGALTLETDAVRLELVAPGDSPARLEAEGQAVVVTGQIAGAAGVLCLNGHPMATLTDAAPLQRPDLPAPLPGLPRSVTLRDPSGSVTRAALTLQSPQAATALHPDSWLIAQEFDAAFYLEGFAPTARPADPVSHYLTHGWREGRDPAPWFSTRHYLAAQADVAAAGLNPFVHYCTAGRQEGRPLARLGWPPLHKALVEAHAHATAPGPEFEEFDPAIGRGRRPQAKVLAYYLTQFHPVPVNDRNWGKGFTEWRNIPRGLPRFEGHIQPRIPRDLGYYDLVESDVMRRQIEMARAAGLFGFCFYYYWFDGERVLETPIERMLADPSLDFPFCLMWANENWTRTWDGHERDVLMAQSYRPEDDAAFLADLVRHFRDPRYIRLGDRPLVFIYRPGQIPDAPATIARWREMLRRDHGEDPLILMAQGFHDLDPRAHGLDGAIEFPPHKLCQDMPNIAGRLPLFDADYKGHVVDYDAMVARALEEPAPDFPLIRTLVPSWDNEARRPGRGMVIQGSTPAKFEHWLRQSIAHARKHPLAGESLVCINAWNEWAEGAYLEPDVHFGGAYLNAVARAVHGLPARAEAGRWSLLICGHDAERNGAQMLALHLGKVLSRRFGVAVSFLLSGAGPLLDDYRALGPTEVVRHDDPARLGAVLGRLVDAGQGVAVVNTTAAGGYLPALKAQGFATLALVHELPGLIREHRIEGGARAIAEKADRVIFPAEVVREGFLSVAGAIAGDSEILPQGLYKTELLDMAPDDGDGDGGLRAELGLPQTARIVLGVGYADLRKGIDRFLSTALALCRRDPTLVFLWVGAPAPEAISWFLPDIAKLGLADRIRLTGHVEDVARYYAAADLFFLTSREDPFPSVVMEALALGLPVVGYAGTGGCDALIAEHGSLVPADDPAAAGAAIVQHLALPPARAQKAARARRAAIRADYRFDDYAFALLQRLQPGLARVSVVLPNYNYEAYLADRLQTIFDQSHPVLEVLVLDDASPDGSVAECRRVAEAAGREIDLHVNSRNSGSPFPQWRKGLGLARGDYVWIAEADDLATPDFLDRLVGRMQASGAAIGFCDMWQVDQDGTRIGDSYRPYLNQIEPGAFDTSFDMAGPEFLARFLAVKNVILNVSGVVFRRDALEAAMAAVGAELTGYSVAGDWRLYAEICAAGGRVSYEAAALNGHRRHATSVTHALKAEKHLAEIAGMQALAAMRAPLSPQVLRQQQDHYAACRHHLEAPPA